MSEHRAYPIVKATVRDLAGEVVKEVGPERANSIEVDTGTTLGATVEFEITDVEIEI